MAQQPERISESIVSKQLEILDEGLNRKKRTWTGGMQPLDIIPLTRDQAEEIREVVLAGYKLEEALKKIAELESQVHDRDHQVAMLQATTADMAVKLHAVENGSQANQLEVLQQKRQINTLTIDVHEKSELLKRYEKSKKVDAAKIKKLEKESSEKTQTISELTDRGRQLEKENKQLSDRLAKIHTTSAN